MRHAAWLLLPLLASACYPNPDDLRNTGGTAGTGGGCVSPGGSCTADNQCCQSGSGVTEGAWCISQTDQCHAKCSTNTDCVSNCCVPVTGQALGACMSASYCGGLKGVGDPCAAGTECESGICGGWCQQACGVGNAVCRSTSSSLKNENGFYNWCFSTSSGASCFPGCDTTADCAVYGNQYTCKTATDVTGFTTQACSL
jgi:hypothetical protein